MNDPADEIQQAVVLPRAYLYLLILRGVPRGLIRNERLLGSDDWQVVLQQAHDTAHMDRNPAAYRLVKYRRKHRTAHWIIMARVYAETGYLSFSNLKYWMSSDAYKLRKLQVNPLLWTRCSNLRERYNINQVCVYEIRTLFQIFLIPYFWTQGVDSILSIEPPFRLILIEWWDSGTAPSLDGLTLQPLFVQQRHRYTNNLPDGYIAYIKNLEEEAAVEDDQNSLHALPNNNEDADSLGVQA